MIKTIRSSTIVRFCLILTLVMFMFGCRSKTVPPDKPIPPVHFKRMAIIPFQDMTRQFGEHVTIQCGISGRYYTTDKVADGAADFLTNQMATYLKGIKDLDLIPVGQVEGVYSNVLSRVGKELSETDLAVQVGRELDAQAVVVGKIYRYIDRKGGKYSVDTAASVAFDVFLIRVEDGRLYWSGHFDEIQKSLFDNLLNFDVFLKRKGQWVTADQMAMEGLNNLLETFPER